MARLSASVRTRSWTWSFWPMSTVVQSALARDQSTLPSLERTSPWSGVEGAANSSAGHQIQQNQSAKLRPELEQQDSIGTRRSLDRKQVSSSAWWGMGRDLPIFYLLAIRDA